MLWFSYLKAALQCLLDPTWLDLLAFRVAEIDLPMKWSPISSRMTIGSTNSQISLGEKHSCFWVHPVRAA